MVFLGVVEPVLGGDAMPKTVCFPNICKARTLGTIVRKADLVAKCAVVEKFRFEAQW
jgi:hypothetical protein